MNDISCWEAKYKSCTYSESLINKINLQNEKSNHKVDILQIKKAIYYAKKYHGSQKRLSGEPYYSHPLAVAELVTPYCFKTDILVTSILHDTIEDTGLTKDLIEYIFDANIASKVEDLTRVKLDGKTSSAEMIELLWLEKKYDLLLVKFFDRLHNMQTINAKSLEKSVKITTETFKNFISLGMYFKSSIINLNEDITLVNLCYQQLLPDYYHQTISLMTSCEDTFYLPSPFFHNKIIHTKIL